MSDLLSFGSPALLGLALPLLGGLAWRGWRSRHEASGRRRLVGLLLGLTGLCLVVAAAAPELSARDQAQGLVALVDLSPSLPAAVREAAVDRARRLAAAGDRTAWIGFAREPVRVPDAAALATLAGGGLAGPTDLTRALDAARLLLPEGGRVLLLSDGNHLGPVAGPGASSPQQAAAALPRAGIALHTVPVWPDPAPDVALLALRAPAEGAAETKVPVTVEVWCRGAIRVDATQIELLVEGTVQATLPLPAGCTGGGSRLLHGQLLLPRAGRPLLEARRTGAGPDLVPENDRAGATIQVRGPAAVLWVGAPTPTTHPVDRLLEEEGHQRRRLPPEELAGRADELPTYDLLVLDDVGAVRLRAGAAQALAGYVRGGGGLLVLGGPRSFGAGGYAETPLDRLLPVSSDLRRTGGRMAVLLLIDKSGSMGGREEGWERLLLAKQTLRALLGTLGRPDDEVVVLGFDTGARRLLPRTRVADLDLEGLDTGEVQAGGGTDPTPALQAAAAELAASACPVRQVIAITDGRFAGTGVEPAVRELVRQGIRFSAIGVGGQAEMGRLERLATLGRGGVSRVLQARELPRAVLAELIAATGGPVRHGEIPVEPGSALADLGVTLPLPVPPLAALNRTVPQEGSSRWLQTSSGEPLLTAIRRDAGLAVAFAAAPGRWTPAWAGWPGERSLWRAVVARTASRPSLPWEASARVVGPALELELRAAGASGRPETGRPVTASVRWPDGHGEELPLPEAEPGLYRARRPADQPGRIRVSFTVGGTRVAEADAVEFTPRELRQLGNDRPLLGELAALGQGELLGADQPLPPPPRGRRQPRPLGGLCFGLALVLFFAGLVIEGWGARPARGSLAPGRRETLSR